MILSDGIYAFAFVLGLIVATITQIINTILLPTVLPYMIVGFVISVWEGVFQERILLVLSEIHSSRRSCSDCRDGHICTERSSLLVYHRNYAAELLGETVDERLYPFVEEESIFLRWETKFPIVKGKN